MKPGSPLRRTAGGAGLACARDTRKGRAARSIVGEYQQVVDMSETSASLSLLSLSMTARPCRYSARVGPLSYSTLEALQAFASLRL